MPDDGSEIELDFVQSAPPAVAERRLQPRYVVRRGAMVLTPDKKVIEVRTLDISFGGVGVVSPEALPKRVLMLCRMNLLYRSDTDKLYDVAVEAMNCIYSAQHGGFKVGFQYRPISPSLQEAIRAMA